MDSSSAGAMDRAIFVSGGTRVVSMAEGTATSMSMTTSLPPKVRRFVLFDKSVPESSV